MGDFGKGWTIGIKNMRLQESAVPGEDWYSVLQADVLEGGYKGEGVRPCF